MAEWTVRFDGRIDVRPPLSERRLAEVPAQRGVVAMLAAGDAPVTLITAADMRARLRSRLSEPPDERRRTVDLRKVTRAVCWLRTDSHFETDLQYFELARQVRAREYRDMVDWKPAWFVHVDLAGAAAAMRVTRRLFAEPGRYVGPFPSGKSGRRFVAALEDAFDLCRDVSLLVKAPHARPCAYGQMGRCLRACDGTVSMDAYRRRVEAAMRYAVERGGPQRCALKRQMREASGALDFERAAALKSRLQRLAELDEPDFRHVRPAERFQFILVHPGRGRRKARPFLVDRGRIVAHDALDWPLKPEQLEDLVARMRRLTDRDARPDEPGRWRIGLVAKYLFSAPRRRGLAVHWSDSVDAAALGERIGEARAALGLSDRVGPDAR